ncbi:hypothetical protein BSKO_13650 [Bryopsis sp. KO-2023]|nr:hypothetical protein BSKO_13650 [Bryopsis sp. KO-2023]
MPRFLRSPQGEKPETEQSLPLGRFRPARFSRRRLTPETPEPHGRKRTRMGPPTEVKKVDFTKLKSTTLRRYVKTFGVRGVHLYSNKEDLCQAIHDHFASMVVTEGDVIADFKRKLTVPASKSR